MRENFVKRLLHKVQFLTKTNVSLGVGAFQHQFPKSSEIGDRMWLPFNSSWFSEPAIYFRFHLFKILSFPDFWLVAAEQIFNLALAGMADYLSYCKNPSAQIE